MTDQASWGGGHGLVLANAYIIYKTLFEEVKVKPMSHYEFRRLVCLAKVDTTHFGGRDHLVSAVQRQGIKKCGSTETTTVSEIPGKENKWQDRTRNLDI